MKIKLRTDVQGWVAGVYHPQAGTELNVDDKIGEALCGSGRASPVDLPEQREASVVTAPENAAETTKRPREKAPRKNRRA